MVCFYSIKSPECIIIIHSRLYIISSIRYIYLNAIISSPIQTILSVLESHQISLRSRTSRKLVTAGWELHPTPKKYLIHDLIIALLKTYVNNYSLFIKKYLKCYKKIRVIQQMEFLRNRYLNHS